MFRSRIATVTVAAALAAGAVVGFAPLAAAAPAAVAASACVSDLQAAQASNSAAIAADQTNDTKAAFSSNLSTSTSLVSALGDCAGQLPVVGANVLMASATNAAASVYNLLGAASSALSSEQATASSISQALASAT
ncbi:hypothetical protein OOK13_40710 [Streptomyces sp. NBC_00378]|uniref:hypothetical protein n=1 Tax=unclassified Streptomyces TaxID=2593676 RepID=UPI002258D2F8|nr:MULTISPECIES: hypothetical protein [unclassified Streptomyces]MCX5114682.1 hypothetical protein [Streptomyces sp. NBC_00378]